MSNYHIGEKTADNRYVTVYIHLAIPANVTVAGAAIPDGEPNHGITYQTALAQKMVGRDVTQMQDHATLFPIENGQLINGELFEKEIRFRFSSTELTNAERRSEIENGNDNEIGVLQMLSDVSILGTETYNEIIAPLEWWGYHRDV